MAMEVHGALGHDIDCFIGECACFFHDRRSGGHLSLSFNFLSSMLILFFNVL